MSAHITTISRRYLLKTAVAAGGAVAIGSVANYASGAQADESPSFYLWAERGIVYELGVDEALIALDNGRNVTVSGVGVGAYYGGVPVFVGDRVAAARDPHRGLVLIPFLKQIEVDESAVRSSDSVEVASKTFKYRKNATRYVDGTKKSNERRHFVFLTENISGAEDVFGVSER